jgi:para-nitrobenzyl esterase
MRRPLLLLTFPTLLLAAACDDTGSSTPAPAPKPGPTAINTDKGPIQGAIVGETRAFLGIPYAAPPVGDLRWKPPQPHAPWTEPLDATQKGPRCPQLSALSSDFDGTSKEDCLTLNVWTPKVEPATKAPVMLWIHGGSFTIGSGGDRDYDGQKLSEATGAVVVTINYRLGPLGFLSHAALRTEDAAHPSAGMYGFEDQRAALEWARDNIAAFGGDPGNVTLFGESAGGISTCLHLLSPGSKGLFHRAIIESGACATPNGRTEIEAEAQGADLAKALGCDNADPAMALACMRGKKPEEVLVALPTSPFNILTGGASWSPVIDKLNITDDPRKLLVAGDFAHVPTLLGTNADEGTIFFAFQSPVTDEASYLAFVDAQSPGNGKAIVEHYPSATFGSPKAAAAAALGDVAFTCPARTTARALAKAGVPAYLYHYVHVSQGLLSDVGAFHSSEIPMVFGNPTQLLPQSPRDEEMPLFTMMTGYWGRMAEKADPNGDGAFAWPKYDASTEENIVLDLMPSKEAGLKKADCDFWDSLY